MCVHVAAMVFKNICIPGYCWIEFTKKKESTVITRQIKKDHMYNINNLEVFLRRVGLVVDCVCDGRESLLSPFTVTAGNWKWLSVTLNAL